MVPAVLGGNPAPVATNSNATKNSGRLAPPPASPPTRNKGMKQDDDLANELQQALNNWEARRPRNNQLTLGPSALGGCREYIRATIAGDEQQGGKTDRGLDGALVGTILGAQIESVFTDELGYQHEVPVTINLHELGIDVAGHADTVSVERNWVGDLKSVNGLAETRNVGPSLKYLTQISGYTYGLVQMGTLKEGATASLIYYDRAGSDKKFLVYTITWEEILGYIQIINERLQNVFRALEAGSPDEMRWQLRDEEPSFCHYIKCPFRLNCWGGSDWVGPETIESEEGVRAVESYVRARQAAKDADSWKRAAREALIGRQGITITESGAWSVSWKGPEGRQRLDVLPL